MARHFDDWIAAYLASVEGRTEAPMVLHFWSAVSTLAATLTRGVWIDEIVYKYYPNFYIVLAARPGVAKKSTTVECAMSLLRAIRPDKIGPDETTWPDFAKTLASMPSYHAIKETPSGWVRDVDPGADSVYLPQCAMTLCIDEFGTFLKPNDRDMINGLTALFGCRDYPYRKGTKTSGKDTIQNPFVNLIGCTTGKWLRDNFIQFASWGFASRIVFVHTDVEPAQLIWSPSRLIDNTDWERQRQLLREDLEVIFNLYGPVTFSPEAAVVAEQWYTTMMAGVLDYSRKTDADPWVVDFLARKQVHVHKLAMVLSVSRRDTLVIHAADYLDAIQHVDRVEAEIRRVFGIHLTPSASATLERALYDCIHADLSNGLGGAASRQYVLSRMSTFVDGSAAERILKSFLLRGLFHEDMTMDGVRIRLPIGTVDYTGGHHHA